MVLTESDIYEFSSMYIRFKWTDFGMSWKEWVSSILLYPIAAPVCIVLMVVLRKYKNGESK